uniref:CDC42 effector protein (Rho GTPase binding) 5 n=1 Tax=Xiphophorus couchianus TaxID=32473 RepID=A0A3B5MZK8_9TELE
MSHLALSSFPLFFPFPPTVFPSQAMPLHKPSRAHRLDPTMISAPLGDFRHTMHIGRGGDAFGDTSFLSTAGPSPTTSELSGSGILPAADLEAAVNHGDLREDASQSPQLQHSESMSSLTMDLDLDLDLGPSILGDVLGVMDSLSLYSNGEAVHKLTCCSTGKYGITINKGNKTLYHLLTQTAESL